MFRPKVVPLPQKSHLVAISGTAYQTAVRSDNSAAVSGSRRRLDGRKFQDLLEAASDALNEATRRLDDLNVYPVPDGDTGTNLRLTLKGALEAARRTDSDSFSEVAKAAARGALRVARGNSGVMLSQWLSVLAETLGGADAVSGAGLARALDAAADGARAAVLAPVDGTILTAMRQAADGALAVRGGPARRVMVAAAGAEQAALDSPRLLPVLARAGVVDAGALGFAIMLRAMAARLSARPATVLPSGIDAMSPLPGWRDAAHAAMEQARDGNVCLQLSIEGTGIDREALRRELQDRGDSLLVAGDDRLARVHLHTSDVAASVDVAARFGEVGGVAETRIDAASERFLSSRPRTAVVAVVDGDGWRRLYREFGATVMDAVDPTAAVDAEGVIFIDTAGAGETELPAGWTRLPASDAAAGLAALLALDPEEGPDTNLDAMQAAAAGVLSFAAADVDEAVSLAAGVEAAGALLTVYRGASADDAGGHSLLRRLRAWRPELTVDVIYGGQSAPAYLLALEA